MGKKNYRTFRTRTARPFFLPFTNGVAGKPGGREEWGILSDQQIGIKQTEKLTLPRGGGGTAVQKDAFANLIFDSVVVAGSDQQKRLLYEWKFRKTFVR